MLIDDAVSIICAYLDDNYTKDGTSIVKSEIKKISKRPFNNKMEVAEGAYTYECIQNQLSKLNEKESIRKNKGVYYTPSDVVDFILLSGIRALYGKLNNDSIGRPELPAIPYKSFCITKTVFDPTCGAGEFLLRALVLKYELLNDHYKDVPAKVILQTVGTLYGNDVNTESIVITKLRLLLCTLEFYGPIKCKGIANVLNRHFYSYDYVLNEPEKKKYDVIVGNPPYVEDFKSGLELKDKYGNIYANVLINASAQLEDKGAMGFIIPLSYISTPRMKKLRNRLLNEVKEQFILSYADRPDCLFDSVHQKLCILIGKSRKTEKKVFTGNYQYWYKDERPQLFVNTNVVKNPYSNYDYLPKLGTTMDVDIFKKITDPQKTVSVYSVSRVGNETVYLNRRETFWMKAYRWKIDDPDYKVFYFVEAQQADYCYCLINSSLFWWFWICTSDCWHVSKELNGFMAPFNKDIRKASGLANALRDRLEATKVYVGTKQTDYEYKHRECITEIHAIDDFVNSIFGLTPVQSSYIKDFAFRYRTSGGAETE